MPQVLNRSKNASALINGIQFTKTANGMISAEITQEQADYFLKMSNYVAVKAAPTAPTAKVTKSAATLMQDGDVANAAAEASAAAERQAAELAAAKEAAKEGQKE
jgi:hypothetical protein